MSQIDRVARLVLGAILVGLYFFGVVGGKIGSGIMGLGALMMITGLAGFCPLYTPFGISTKSSEE